MKNSKHVFHLYVIRTSKRDELKKYLREYEIETGIHYPKALPNLPAYSYLNNKASDFPVASKYQNEILSLPIYPELRDEQIVFLTGKIKDYFGSI